MGKGKPIIIATLVIIALLCIGVFGLDRMVPRMETRITGYSGMTSEFVDVTHQYTEANNWQTTVSATTAKLWPGYFTVLDPTGLRAELGQPQFYDTRKDWSDSINNVDTTAKTNITESWEVHIVTLRMGLAVYTDGGGIGAATDVSFWVQITENPYSVFQNADESAAYILEARTYKDAEESESTLVDVEPKSSGYSFELTPTSTEAAPQWIIDSGYSGNLKDFKSVKFPVSIIEMRPYNNFGFRSAENDVRWYIEIDVLLFGHWEVMSPYVEFDAGGDDEIPLLDQLLAFLLQTGWILGGFVIMIAVLYVAPSKWKVIGPVIFVIFLLIGTGIIDIGAFLGGDN